MEKIMNVYRLTILSLVYFTLIATIVGCKSPAVVTDTVDDDKVEESIFSARQDTVKVQTYSGEIPDTDALAAGIVEYYTVQIGAFEDPMNAEKVYRKAQQRFNLETNTDYDSIEELYKITVGKFMTYEQARAFCDRIIRDFPADYQDAWVVEMTQRQRRKLQ